MINTEKLVALWNKYSKKEQLMLIITVIFIIIIVIYQFIYLPIYNIRTKKLLEIQEKKDTVMLMQQIMPFIKQNKAKSIHPTELMGFIQNELTTSNFKTFPSQINQVNGTDVEIIFKKVPFNLFLAWFFELNQKYQFVTKSLEATNSFSNTGVCKLRVVIGSHSTQRFELK